MNREPDSLTKVFESEVEGKRHRFAVMTFTAKELENLRQFGDVLFIDGTMSQLRLRWEILPITGVDQHRQLASCGIMYPSGTNEEVLTWMLSELWQILEPNTHTQRELLAAGQSPLLAALPRSRTKGSTI